MLGMRMFAGGNGDDDKHVDDWVENDNDSLLW